MGSNDIDIKEYFDIKFDSIKEYFDEKFKRTDDKIDNIKDCQRNDIQNLNGKFENHEKRITKLESVEGRKAIGFLGSIKDSIIKYTVPALIVVLVYLLGNGSLLRLLGIGK